MNPAVLTHIAVWNFVKPGEGILKAFEVSDLYS